MPRNARYCSLRQNSKRGVTTSTALNDTFIPRQRLSKTPNEQSTTLAGVWRNSPERRSQSARFPIENSVGALD